MNSIREKKFLLQVFFSILIFLIFFQDVCSQEGKLPDYKYIFHNDFEVTDTGRYRVEDFNKQWYSPQGNNRQNTLHIENEQSPHRHFMRGFFPAGTFGAEQCGWSWYTNLNAGYEELYFSYDVRFKPGFEWVAGGKLPGLTGGSVTAGVRPRFSDGFSVRWMWKENGTLVLYVYHQKQEDPYGSTYEISNFHLLTGRWYHLTLRVVLNTVADNAGLRNGVIEGFVDGKHLFRKDDFVFRNDNHIKISRLYICSFFGGGDARYKSVRDEWIDTDNYKVYIPGK